MFFGPLGLILFVILLFWLFGWNKRSNSGSEGNGNYLPNRPSRTCPNCRNVLHGSYSFCPSCGTSLNSKCTQCGTAVDPDWKYCPKCGKAH